MNIFVLDLDHSICAKYHADKHVGKMALESAQLLSTAHSILDKTKVGYRPTHAQHPCAKWVRQSTSNYSWLYDLYLALCYEFSFRYNKMHGAFDISKEISSLPANLHVGPLTPFALAMPNEYKTSDPIASYRNYYRHEKKHLHAWTKRQPPEWISTSS